MTKAEIDKITKEFEKYSLPENIWVIPDCTVIDGQLIAPNGNRVPIERYDNFALVQQETK